MELEKERPILFNGPMVRAILEGRKTQTRRVIKPQPSTSSSSKIVGEHKQHHTMFAHQVPLWLTADEFLAKYSPYGVPGDRLWVRETWAQPTYDWKLEERNDEYFRLILYAADNGREFFPLGGNYIQRKNCVKWRPSTYMPRWASRITLEVVSVRVERLQDISESDAIAEGIVGTETDDGEGYYYCVETDKLPVADSAVEVYAMLWDSINAARGYGWDANPWVWVVEFKKEKT